MSGTTWLYLVAAACLLAIAQRAVDLEEERDELRESHSDTWGQLWRLRGIPGVEALERDHATTTSERA